MMRFVLPLMAVSVLASACTPVGMVAGTGASLGVASMQEGGIAGAADDIRIKALISDLWFKYDLKTFAKLSTTVDQGRVLITGVVQDPDDRVEAVRLAWQVNGVKQVINEIQVADSEGFPGYVRDQWISTRLRTAMVLNRDITSLNYSIDTVQGTVYLMGAARGQQELDMVIEAARTIPHVRDVVSYVKMMGEAVPDQGTAPAASGVSLPAPTQPAANYGAQPMTQPMTAPETSPQTGAPGRAAPIDAEALPPW